MDQKERIIEQAMQMFVSQGIKSVRMDDIANMDAITSNYGPAPRAFFVVSIVGAFFIDIVNAVVIQSFVAFL